MPFISTAKRPSLDMNGCALRSNTPPCVAQRVWPMPRVAGEPFDPAIARSFSTLPILRARTSEPSSTRTSPAES